MLFLVKIMLFYAFSARILKKHKKHNFPLPRARAETMGGDGGGASPPNVEKNRKLVNFRILIGKLENS